MNPLCRGITANALRHVRLMRSANLSAVVCVVLAKESLGALLINYK